MQSHSLRCRQDKSTLDVRTRYFDQTACRAFRLIFFFSGLKGPMGTSVNILSLGWKATSCPARSDGATKSLLSGILLPASRYHELKLAKPDTSYCPQDIQTSTRFQIPPLRRVWRSHEHGSRPHSMAASCCMYELGSMWWYRAKTYLVTGRLGILLS